ncbi:MAG TPA: hypothetical protein VFR61_01655 [Nitrososphaeraceae archaeon]|nr:hypothetical protein [Nitrososphaeraceae archaeon]
MSNIVIFCTVPVIFLLVSNVAFANTIIMIPEASSTKESWNPRFIENLSENNTLIFIENKGDSIEQMAGNIKLNETVDVIGFSMGGITKSLIHGGLRLEFGLYDSIESPISCCIL